jgi:hypothetical protein
LWEIKMAMRDQSPQTIDLKTTSVKIGEREVGAP